MKRDMDLIRAILLEVEKLSVDSSLYSKDISLEKWDEDNINYHCKLLIEYGLLEGQVSKELSKKIPFSFITSLTWEGHDFLDACRDDTRWKKATEIFKKIGGSVSLDIAKETLKKIAIEQINSFL